MNINTAITYSLSSISTLEEVIAAEFSGHDAEVDAYIADTDWDAKVSHASKFLNGFGADETETEGDYDEYLDLKIIFTR